MRKYFSLLGTITIYISTESTVAIHNEIVYVDSFEIRKKIKFQNKFKLANWKSYKRTTPPRHVAESRKTDSINA